MDVIEDVLNLPEHEIRTLFKPKQKEVLVRIMKGEPLDSNQQRYLRGDIRKKIDTLSSLEKNGKENEKRSFLKGVENYYITGYDALKHNGYGWYFSTKRIIVMNTRLEGTFHVPGAIIKLIRLRSLKNRSFSVDEETRLKFASNEQIFKDAEELGDEALRRECLSHLKRYGELFIEGHERYLNDEPHFRFEPEDFGV